MTRPLSNDLRERVERSVLVGESCRSVAARFGIAVSTAVKWSQRYRATGLVAPAKMGGQARADSLAPELEQYLALSIRMYERTERENSWRGRNDRTREH
jgi:transposase